ncbi:protein STRUBBELIG-receptor family 8 [Tanacetum coccineum]
MQNGIFASYDEWTHHGESCDVSDDSDDDVSFNDEDVGNDNMNGDNDDDDADANDDLDEMLDNICQGTWGDKWKTNDESSSSIDKDLESLRRLLDDSHQELYTGCQSYSKFLFIVTMLHLKTTNGWYNKSFNDTLNVFKKALPSSSSVPKNYYEAKNISWIGEPGGQGSGELGGQGTRGPVGLSTCWPGGASIHEPGGPITREFGGPGTHGPGGLSSRDLQKSFTRIINHGEEDDQEDTHEIDHAQIKTDTSDDELEENIGLTSHGKTITQKDTRALGETRKSCLNKKNLVFEVDDCSGWIVGDDGQRFITKEGCENSNYDETCDNMEHAMQKQLASQHKNKKYKLHLHFKKYPSKEAAMMHPPDGVRTRDWVNLCDRFASKAFQKISAKNKKNRSFNKVPPAVGSLSVARRVYKKKRKWKEVTAIGMYEIAHYSKKTHKMVNEEAEKVLHILGHIKGCSASTRNILGNEKLRLDSESEKERS